jgi:hypothetical protein
LRRLLPIAPVEAGSFNLFRQRASRFLSSESINPSTSLTVPFFRSRVAIVLRMTWNLSFDNLALPGNLVQNTLAIVIRIEEPAIFVLEDEVTGR